MAKIDPEDFARRVEKISGIFENIVDQAQTQSLTRCPYKNMHDQCTAKFGCQNQRKPPVSGDPLLCGHDGKLNYRSAWEEDPDLKEKVRKQLRGEDD